MAENLDIATAAIPDGSRAFIVGPNHFQNVLFAAYVETHSEWKCSVVNSIASIPRCDTAHHSGQLAVLYDCYGLSSDHLTDSPLAGLEELPSDWTLVLFNLDRQAGIEKSAIEFGVHGFFYQDDAVETLLKGLSAILRGEFWASRQKLTEVILEQGFALRRKQNSGHGTRYGLTRREIEILGLLSLGAANRVISEKLFISPHTVRTHLNNIFRKIKVSTRLEAVVWAGESLFVHKPE